MDLLDHVTFLVLIFLGTDILFSLVAAPLCIPTNNTHRFQFLYILDNASNFLSFFFFYLFCLFFGSRHANGCKIFFYNFLYRIISTGKIFTLI